jgi:undecaprenyl-diphosphatase
LAQVIALLPGTSRTGITMTAGRFLAFERLEAARFVLLLSVPAGFGRLALLAREALRSEVPALEAPVLLAGLLAFVSALLAIWFLMTCLKRANACIFAIDRVLAGARILYWYYVTRPV